MLGGEMARPKKRNVKKKEKRIFLTGLLIFNQLLTIP